MSSCFPESQLFSLVLLKLVFCHFACFSVSYSL
jgi:hypothetical protein